MALKIAKDHWAFLDEIEAPMWVDLTLEAKSNYKDVDDGWFHTSHLFHQWPSFELKAAFSHSGDGGASFDIDLKGQCSPKLPSSVSRSRGKHYGRKKNKEGQHIFSLDKQHPVKVLSGKTSLVNSGSGEETKPKVSFINSKGPSRSKTSFVAERNLTGNAKKNVSKAMSSHGGSQGTLSCMEDKPVDSNTSTITSESDQKPQQKNMEVSSYTFGYSSGLVSAIRTSLRKSCVTRQASRVDVNNRRQSRDGNSVSGKSSVGSSSNPSNDTKNSTLTLKQQREQTPDSRYKATTIRATKNRGKISTMSKASNVQVQDGNCNSRIRGISKISKPAQHYATKSKVQNQTLCAKALMPLGVNEQNLLNVAPKKNDKVTALERNIFVAAGNENTTGKVLVNQKCHGGDSTAGVMAGVQKGTKKDAPQKGDRTSLVGPKEKVRSPGKGKRPTTSATQRVYLR